MMRKTASLALSVFFVLISFNLIANAADFTMPGFDPKYPDKAHCRISMAKVNDPTPPLNVRSSPVVLPNNIVGTIEQGKWLVVEEERDGWFRISPFMGAEKPKGWVAKNRTDYDCNFFREELTTTPVTLRGRFIGMGSHEYLIRLEKGQTLILTVGQIPGERLSGWPFLMYSTTQDVPGMPGPYGNDTKGLSADGTQWTWVVTDTQIYRLSYESNFKGFDYNLTVEVR